MKIKDRLEFVSKPNVYTAAENESVLNAAKTMSERNIGSVVVIEDDRKVVGLVTERDLLRRIIAAGRDPAQTKLADIMSTELKLANQNDEVAEWLRIMSNERFRRLPVVDDDGRLVTIMTQGDFVSYTWPELLKVASAKVEEKVGSNNQHLLILGGALLYAVAMVFLLR
ncbi:CBS domain-containing protein [Nisaea sp.]|uniref:CBS domain-containing protein n=1 Tax=Nisaea sp. TaxID=2024842 RepID=UPI0032981A2D